MRTSGLGPGFSIVSPVNQFSGKSVQTAAIRAAQADSISLRFSGLFSRERKLAPVVQMEQLGMPPNVQLFYDLMKQAVLSKDSLGDFKARKRREEALTEIRGLLKSKKVSPNTIPYSASYLGIPMPMGYAAQKGDVELMALLYEFGGDINLRSTEVPVSSSAHEPTESVFMYALSGGHAEAIDWLLGKKELTLGVKTYTNELGYVQSGDKATYEKLMAAGLDLNQPIYYEQRTLLHGRAASRDLGSARVLLELGAKPGNQDFNGNNTLHALVEGYMSYFPSDTIEREKAKAVEMAKLLVAYDDPESSLRTTRNKAGKTPADLLTSAYGRRFIESEDGRDLQTLLQVLEPA